MNEITDFVVRHWELTAAFAVVLIAYLFFELRERSSSCEISVEQTIEMYNHQHGVLLDIRDSAAYNTGHILGAINIERTELEAKLKQLNKYNQKPIIVICNTGSSAPKTVKLLHENGFAQAYSLAGGMGAWRSANLPVITAEAANKSKSKAQDQGL